jgi:hypothetical protein
LITLVEEMDTSAFEQIASSLTVKSICDPVSPDIQASSTIAEMIDQLYPDDLGFDPINNPSRVIDSDGAFIGMLWYDDYLMMDRLEDKTIVEDVMRVVTPDECLSSSTAVMDAVSLFATRHHDLFYLIDVNQVSGVLRYRDLFKPLGRLTFLALALEIEDLAVRLCQSTFLRAGCWSALSEGRKDKAVEQFKLNYEREVVRGEESSADIFRLIGCTQLKDKASMIWKQRLIAGARQADVLGVFERLREVRDRCAHPGDYKPPLPKEDLAAFIKSERSLRSSLWEAMQKHNVEPPTENPWIPC